MKLEDLSKLHYQGTDFDQILEFVSQIKNAKIDDEVESPMVTLGDLRADEVRPSLAQSEILANAPKTDDQYFIVPKVVE